MTTAPTTELTVIERASVALGAAEHEKKLIELAARSKDITGITNQDAYKECHSCRMVLKNERINLERLGKAAREDAQKFAKAVIAEETRLISLIEPEEKRLQVIQSEFDAIEKRAAEAAAKRIEDLQARIVMIQNVPVAMAGKRSADIQGGINYLNALDVTEYAEFAPMATEARDKALIALNQLLAGAVAQEQLAAAEQAKIEAERAELAKLRAEKDERDKADAARAAQEAAERPQAEAESRAKIEAEEAASRVRIAEEERVAREAREAEETRLAQERAEREKAQAREDARLKAQRDELEAKQREVQRQADELLSGAEMLRTFIDRFGRRKEFEQVVAAIRVYLQKQPRQ